METPGHRTRSNERWQTIELRHLAALAAVSQERSFGRAAERLGYVQSAISGQIAHLERAAGARLVERSSGTATVSLTPAGELLLTHSEEIMARFEAAYADMSTLATRSALEVRIAGLELFGPARVARLVRAFRARCPIGRIVLQRLSPTQTASEALAAGTLDGLVCELPVPEEMPEHLVLERDRMVLLVAAGTTRARSAQIHAQELADMRLMVPSSCQQAAALESALSAVGAGRRSSLRPGSVASAQAGVAAGLGEAIVPSRLVDPTESRTVAVELALELPDCGTALVLASQASGLPAIQAFIRAARVAIEAERAAESESRNAQSRRRPVDRERDAVAWPASAPGS